MFYVTALIREVKAIGPGYFRVKLVAPDIANEAKPGQFIEFRVNEAAGTDPLLPRPISIYRINRTEGSISVIFKVVGRGTASLASKREGEEIGIWGPIGNGFTIPESVKNIALIAGGIGMPPLFCLAEETIISGAAVNFHLFYGGRSETDFLELDCWQQLKIPVAQATDDGSIGFHGLVTDLFSKQNQQTQFDYLVACGPSPMLKAVQKTAVLSMIPGQISLESYMACGVGACLGCTCKTNRGYQRVCVDGPVFSIKEVVFND